MSHPADTLGAMRHHYRPDPTTARRLRLEMTPAESVLWARLRRGTLGARFRRQEPIGPYVVDFVSRSAGLVVEVDGDGHGSRWYGDRERDADLRRWGLRVMRIENRAVFTQLDDVVTEIARLVGERDAEPIWFG